MSDLTPKPPARCEAKMYDKADHMRPRQCRNKGTVIRLDSDRVERTICSVHAHSNYLSFIPRAAVRVVAETPHPEEKP